MHLLVPTGTGETPTVVTTPPLIFIVAAILVAMVLLLLVIITSISGGVLIRRLVFKTWISECWSCNGNYRYSRMDFTFSSIVHSCLNVVPHGHL